MEIKSMLNTIDEDAFQLEDNFRFWTAHPLVFPFKTVK